LAGYFRLLFRRLTHVSGELDNTYFLGEKHYIRVKLNCSVFSHKGELDPYRNF